MLKNEPALTDVEEDGQHPQDGEGGPRGGRDRRLQARQAGVRRAAAEHRVALGAAGPGEGRTSEACLLGEGAGAV